MSSQREALARAIHKAGTTDPDSLAAYLIREGWGKRSDAFAGGVVSAIDAVNAMQASPLRSMVQPLMRETNR
ncbi:hypothetical protein [Microbacterium sp. cx-59]|uniref:hypothetical protein n=1 Tax=Microbacterium sp. cx-59 TaxID=2891207 RepID=UPI001E492814|nr:hypothetical protein [Microbacterium sp. cx-59]MCC4906953.1 hypothetical protein [Microbacterium sp. cx-59]